MACLSCSNKMEVLPDTLSPDQLYDVNFLLSGFSETHSPFEKLASTKGNNSTALINKIQYVILDKDLLPIDTLVRDVYGKINAVSVKLPSGTYTLRAIGYNERSLYGPIIPVYNKYSELAVVFNPIQESGFKSYKVGEVFVLNKKLNVTKDSTYSELVLSRFNSKLELNILDKIPAEIKHIELSVISAQVLYGGSKELKGALTYPAGTTPRYLSSFIDVSGLVNLENQIIETNILTTGQDFTPFVERNSNVKINAYDNSGALVISKEILNVRFIPNTITKLSGNLFDELNSEKENSLAVTIDEDYSSNKIHQQF